MKYAIILQTTEDATQFRSTLGFYTKHIQDLLQAGYQILRIDIDDSTSLAKQTSIIPESSIGFLWLRMHGSPKSMTASKSLKITSNNIADVFNWLPNALNNNAIVFLDSCSTGSLENDFHNNLQFTFAKLTIEKSQVKIIAPSEDSHISYFSISSEGYFRFEILSSWRLSKNIAVILGQQTKSIIKNAILSDISLDSIQSKLIESLQTNELCPFFDDFKKRNLKILIGSGFNTIDLLINTIIHIQKFYKAFRTLKELIEVFHISPNCPADTIRKPCAWEQATPLSAAVFYKRTKIVSYLLEKGADPFYKFKGETVYEFAKRRDTENDTSIIGIVITQRRAKENDNLSIFEVFTQFLNLEKQKHISKGTLHKRYDFWKQPGTLSHPTLEQVSKNHHTYSP